MLIDDCDNLTLEEVEVEKVAKKLDKLKEIALQMLSWKR